MANSFGQRFVLTTFGESHGSAMGGVLDGCPAGLAIDYNAIELALKRRQTGHNPLTSSRNEPDEVEFLSGLFNGVTTGAPLAYIIRNRDGQSAHYDSFSHLYRPGHADYTYDRKYGIRDYRGGGRASGRETVVRVVAGAIANQLLQREGVAIYGFISQIGKINLNKPYTSFKLETISELNFPSPDATISQSMIEAILTAKQNGDSIGGKVTIVVKGVPVGWGEPIFDKLQARLAFAMMSIGGAKGFEYGEGFNAASLKGSEMNDAMDALSDSFFTTNHAGGILGGISNGNDIFFTVAFKPTPSIRHEQETIDQGGTNSSILVTGRHDPCIVPRALVVVEAMTAITLYDAFLMAKNRTI